jgi:hypothetical protein
VLVTHAATRENRHGEFGAAKTSVFQLVFHGAEVCHPRNEAAMEEQAACAA